MSVSPQISAQSASEKNTNASIALHKRTISKLSVESTENKPNSVENPLNSRIFYGQNMYEKPLKTLNS